MSKPLLRLDFSDFAPGLDKQQNYFTDVLSPHYEIQISDRPDLLIYSCYGTDFRRYDCRRVFISWENQGADFTECDFAFTGDHNDDPRHFRLPFYGIRPEAEFHPLPVVGQDVLRAKEGFCSFVVSSPGGRTRNEFFERLNRYKPIASGGRLRNNVGGPVPDKAQFIGRYKFNMAFENSTYPGYTTEKLFDALRARTVPIYWGDPYIERDVDPRCFVNVNAFASMDDAIDRVIELDGDDDRYAQTIEAPWFTGGAAPPFTQRAVVLERFIEIIESDEPPVSRRRPTPAFLVARLESRWRKRQRFRQRVS